MKTKVLEARHGFGTTSIENIISKWIKDNRISNIVDIKYREKKEEFKTYSGLPKVGTVVTALIMYRIDDDGYGIERVKKGKKVLFKAIYNVETDHKRVYNQETKEYDGVFTQTWVRKNIPLGDEVEGVVHMYSTEYNSVFTPYHRNNFATIETVLVNVPKRRRSFFVPIDAIKTI